jgi:hypothetical protein
VCVELTSKATVVGAGQLLKKVIVLRRSAYEQLEYLKPTPTATSTFTSTFTNTNTTFGTGTGTGAGTGTNGPRGYTNEEYPKRRGLSPKHMSFDDER